MEPFTTKKEWVLGILREAILSGDFRPGERLLQDDLAERFDVSSTPVREALRELVAEGVLVCSPHKGVRVAEVRLEAVREVYLMRSALESVATRLATPLVGAAELQRLKALQARMEIQLEKQRELRKLNREFHMLIYQAAGMPQMYQVISKLWLQFPWDALMVLPGRLLASVREHRLILEAIEDGDAALAGRRMQEHIDLAAADLSEYLGAASQGEAADTPADGRH